MLRQDDYIKGRLVEMAYRFMVSYGCGHLGGQMIMSTLANRVRCGWGTWLDTLERVPQYMAEKELPPVGQPNIWAPEFVKLLQTVDGIYEGSAQDLSKGALFWGALNKIENPWFKTKIIQEGQTIDEKGFPVHRRIADLNHISFWT